MLNTLWVLMVVCPIIYCLILGETEETVAALLAAGSSSIELVLEMAGGFMLWCGLMEILRQSGWMDWLGRIMRPMLQKLFPGIKHHETFSAIAMNLAANMLGLGNAATPMGLKAMQLMAEENRNRLKASHGMCLFMVMNSCCIQLLPTTVLTVRTAAGSANPGAILLPSILCSVLTMVLGIIACLVIRRSMADE